MADKYTAPSQVPKWPYSRPDSTWGQQEWASALPPDGSPPSAQALELYSNIFSAKETIPDSVLYTLKWCSPDFEFLNDDDAEKIREGLIKGVESLTDRRKPPATEYRDELSRYTAYYANEGGLGFFKVEELAKVLVEDGRVQKVYEKVLAYEEEERAKQREQYDKLDEERTSRQSQSSSFRTSDQAGGDANNGWYFSGVSGGESIESSVEEVGKLWKSKTIEKWNEEMATNTHKYSDAALFFFRLGCQDRNVHPEVVRGAVELLTGNPSIDAMYSKVAGKWEEEKSRMANKANKRRLDPNSIGTPSKRSKSQEP